MLKIFFGALVTAFFFGVTFWLAVKYYRQNPVAQLRDRLHYMIDQAKAERAKNPKPKKIRTDMIATETPTGEIQIVTRNKNSFYERVILPIIKSINERLQKLAPQEIKIQLEDKIFRAGKLGVWDVKHLITLWCLSIVGCTFFAVVAVNTMMIHPLQRLFLVLLGFLFGALVPFAVLNSKIRQRQKLLRKQLPEFLDILCVSVQAGLSFDGAVGKMIRRMKGPLIDEFRRAQNDVALGMTHQYALTQLARRCDLEEIYLFTTSVIQAEKLGTSMTQTLKVQADNMRDRHRQYVKAEALKAPVKIIFPMIMFIFPSMFVVLLFPAMLTLLRNLGGG